MGTTQSRGRSLRPPSPASPACDPRRLLSHISDILRLPHHHQPHRSCRRHIASLHIPRAETLNTRRYDSCRTRPDQTGPDRSLHRTLEVQQRNMTLCIWSETQPVVSEGERDWNKKNLDLCLCDAELQRPWVLSPESWAPDFRPELGCSSHIATDGFDGARGRISQCEMWLSTVGESWKWILLPKLFDMTQWTCFCRSHKAPCCFPVQNQKDCRYDFRRLFLVKQA